MRTESLSDPNQTFVAEWEALLDELDREIRGAVAVSAVNLPPRENNELCAAFDNTYEANAFVLIRYQLDQNLLMTLGRLWDKVTGAQSIVLAMELLKKPDAVEKLMAGRRQRRQVTLGRVGGANGTIDETLLEHIRKKDQEEAEKQESSDRNSLDELMKRIENFYKSPLIESLLNLRHKALAHNLLITKMERDAKANSREIEELRIGDEQAILDETVAMFAELNLLTRRLSVNIDGTKKIWDDCSERFWKRVLSGRQN